jgi:tRNA (cmo5U34)-methyltransferase
VGLSSHEEGVKHFFEDGIENYDTCAESVVPKNAELHDTVLSLVPFSRDEEFTVVDLGIGTGLLALKGLRMFPNARVVGVDFSKKMLDKAHENLRGFKGRVELVQDSFETVELPDCDVVVSTIAIHNVEDAEKKVLFKKIAGALDSGSHFINGDFIQLRTPLLQKRSNEFYLNFMKANLSGNELEAWTRHSLEQDKPSPIRTQFSWLEEAGFSRVENIWKNYNLSVYDAMK